MDVESAKSEFTIILSKLDQNSRNSFLAWISGTTAEINSKEKCNEDTIINSIQDDLRSNLPITAQFSSEEITFPTFGENADCDPDTTVHVDAFLYDDDQVDELCDEGKLSRSYCTKCGSHQTAPLTFISHSASLSKIKFIYQYALPDLGNKTILDVGSRLGALLYGAFYYSSSSSIYGVEMNKDLCQLQNQIIEKYNLESRVKVICDDICNQKELLQKADVIILQNVFEFFMPVDVQVRIWTLLFESVKKSGTILVMTPSLETSLENLEIRFDAWSWLKELPKDEERKAACLCIFGNDDCQESDLNDIHFYAVR